MKTSLALTISLLAACTLCMADITVGLPASTASGNFFPFGDPRATVYQQVYAADNFAGPLTITGVGFFHTVTPGGSIAGGTYTLSFSTTSRVVNGLDITDLDSNLGADNQLFAAADLSGPVGAELDIMGNPFTYNPANGNLLLDIRVSNRTYSGGDLFLDARNGDAGGIFSRAYNRGAGFADYGLVTKFITDATPSAVPEPGSIALLGTALLLTAGMARRRSVRR